jgi:predicted metal-binding membrane protein
LTPFVNSAARRVEAAVAASDAAPVGTRGWRSAQPLIVAALVTAACWAASVYNARTMSGAMPMPGGWDMSMAWMLMPGQSRVAAAAMFLVMWQVMMVAMMLPSAMPMVLIYRRFAAARRHRPPAGSGRPEPGERRGQPAAPSAVLLAGYFSSWLLFGVMAYVVGFGLSSLAMQDERVSRLIPAATAFALMLSGVYQLTPWKRACLRHCRSPLSFLATCWKPGWLGTLRLGVHHGAYCAGCCWALMVIQLAIGVMNLPLMAVLAGVIWIEKSWRHGEQMARAAGAAAIAAGAIMGIASAL